MKVNKWVNILSFFFFVVSLKSGIILWLFLKPYQGGRNNDFLLSKGLWSDIHLYSSLIFVFLVIIHLFLHKHWFINLFKKKND